MKTKIGLFETKTLAAIEKFFFSRLSQKEKLLELLEKNTYLSKISIEIQDSALFLYFCISSEVAPGKLRILTWKITCKVLTCFLWVLLLSFRKQKPFTNYSFVEFLS